MSGIADASVCGKLSSFLSRAGGSSALLPDMGTTTNRIEAQRKQANQRGQRVLLLTMSEAARVLSVGRTTMYELVGAGEIEVVHIGRSARVPVGALEEFVERRRAGGATVRPRTSAARAKRQLDPGRPTT